MNTFMNEKKLQENDTFTCNLMHFTSSRELKIIRRKTARTLLIKDYANSLTNKSNFFFAFNYKFQEVSSMST